MMRDDAKIFANSLFLILNEGFRAVGSICVIALLARYLGIQKFGDYAFVLAICNIFQVATDMGVNQIVVREIARQKEIAADIFSASLLLRFAFAIVTLAVICISIHLLTSSPEMVRAGYVCGAGVVSMFFYNLTLAIFQAYERMEFVALAGIVTRACYVLLTFVVVWMGGGLEEIFWPILATGMLGFIMGSIVIHKRFFPIRIRGHYSLSWYILRESYLLGIGRIIRKGSFSIDIILLKMMSGSAAAGLFQGVYKPVLQLMFIPRNVTAALFPVISRLFREDVVKFGDTYRGAFKLLTVIMLPTVVFMVYLSREFVEILLGSKFLPSVPAFRILAVVWGLMFLSTLFLRVLTAVNRQNLVTVCIFCALGVNVLLDLVLIPRQGFMGAAWATLFAESALIATSLFFVTQYAGSVKLWKTVLGPCIAGGLITVICICFADVHVLFKSFIILPLSSLAYLAYLRVTKSVSVHEYKWGKELLFSIRRRRKSIVERELPAQ